MRRFSYVLIMLGLISIASPHAKAGTLGLGISVGTGSGLSAYYADHQRYQALLNFDASGHFGFYGDMLFPLVRESDPRWDVLWGVGFLVGNYEKVSIKIGDTKIESNSTYFGARIPFDLLYYVPNTPLQVGIEIAPSLVVSSGTFGFVHSALIVRLLFGV